ncbi:transglutaminase-like domain-containing protein [Solitalea sp. MAHUQ-68]|uniref:Transglutaminase-like domain-containing protein n=1 Tax=Solitalea agri TaxID=2953739 RepID=A0A9X2JCU2_9SPHI|nr:transglutaminase-like domain-containing protein [Solitalea agri]MCO4293438.1 transglutaminase-like domain-containing protein [Solitalea agri]
MIDKNELKSLVKLLDDPDQEVFEHIKNKLVSFGPEIIGYLEDVWQQSLDVLLQERIENIVHKIQFDEVKRELELWIIGGAFDLLSGVLAINKYQYPDLDEQRLHNQIEDIKRDVWLQLGYEMSPLEKVKVLNHVFFHIHGFSGNTVNHQDPQNSYINLVLESKKGNQISLAIIYSLIAQKLDIPIYGVNLPQHFILAYVDENETVLPGFDATNGVIFYINPFNKGFIFGRKDVDFFLKQLKIEQRDEYYQPCSNIEIIKRILRNLISAYNKLGYLDKVEELEELLQVLESH